MSDDREVNAKIIHDHELATLTVIADGEEVCVVPMFDIMAGDEVEPGSSALRKMHREWLDARENR